MSEQTEKYVKLAKRHIDRIVIGVLYLMLAGLIFLWYSEQEGANSISEGGEGKPASIEDPVEKNPAWKSVRAMASPQKIDAYPGVLQIRQYNMFDYKTVKAAEDLQRSMNQKFAQAQEAEKTGKPEEAIRLLNDVLKQKPNYKPARDLLEKLDPKSKDAGTAPAATPSPTPSPTPAA